MGNDFSLNSNEDLYFKDEYGSHAVNTVNSFPTPAVIYTFAIATVSVILNP